MSSKFSCKIIFVTIKNYLKDHEGGEISSDDLLDEKYNPVLEGKTPVLVKMILNKADIKTLVSLAIDSLREDFEIFLKGNIEMFDQKTGRFLVDPVLWEKDQRFYNRDILIAMKKEMNTVNEEDFTEVPVQKVRLKKMVKEFFEISLPLLENLSSIGEIIKAFKIDEVESKLVENVNRFFEIEDDINKSTMKIEDKHQNMLKFKEDYLEYIAKDIPKLLDIRKEEFVRLLKNKKTPTEDIVEYYVRKIYDLSGDLQIDLFIHLLKRKSKIESFKKKKDIGRGRVFLNSSKVNKDRDLIAKSMIEFLGEEQPIYFARSLFKVIKGKENPPKYLIFLILFFVQFFILIIPKDQWKKENERINFLKNLFEKKKIHLYCKNQDEKNAVGELIRKGVGSILAKSFIDKYLKKIERRISATESSSQSTTTTPSQRKNMEYNPAMFTPSPDRSSFIMRQNENSIRDQKITTHPMFDFAKIESLERLVKSSFKLMSKRDTEMKKLTLENDMLKKKIALLGEKHQALCDMFIEQNKTIEKLSIQRVRSEEKMTRDFDKLIQEISLVNVKIKKVEGDCKSLVNQTPTPLLIDLSKKKEFTKLPRHKNGFTEASMWVKKKDDDYDKGYEVIDSNNIYLDSKRSNYDNDRRDNRKMNSFNNNKSLTSVVLEEDSDEDEPILRSNSRNGGNNINNNKRRFVFEKKKKKRKHRRSTTIEDDEDDEIEDEDVELNTLLNLGSRNEERNNNNNNSSRKRKEKDVIISSSSPKKIIINNNNPYNQEIKKIPNSYFREVVTNNTIMLEPLTEKYDQEKNGNLELSTFLTTTYKVGTIRNITIHQMHGSNYHCALVDFFNYEDVEKLLEVQRKHYRNRISYRYRDSIEKFQDEVLSFSIPINSIIIENLHQSCRSSEIKKMFEYITSKPVISEEEKNKRRGRERRRRRNNNKNKKIEIIGIDFKKRNKEIGSGVVHCAIIQFNCFSGVIESHRVDGTLFRQKRISVFPIVEKFHLDDCKIVIRGLNTNDVTVHEIKSLFKDCGMMVSIKIIGTDIFHGIFLTKENASDAMHQKSGSLLKGLIVTLEREKY